jgi:hypothetical protein
MNASTTTQIGEPMKSILLLAAFLLSLSSQASYSVVNLLCENDRGVELELTITALESWPPPHKLVMSYKGHEEKNLLVREVFKYSHMDYAFIGMEGDKEIFIGVDLAKESVFYQEAANNGMSPLPGIQFDNCIIEAGN